MISCYVPDWGIWDGWTIPYLAGLVVIPMLFYGVTGSLRATTLLSLPFVVVGTWTLLLLGGIPPIIGFPVMGLVGIGLLAWSLWAFWRAGNYVESGDNPSPEVDK